MASANPYQVTVKVNGEEITVNTFAYNVHDAAMQVILQLAERGEVKLVRIGPPPEACQGLDVTRMLNRMLGKDE